MRRLVLLDLLASCQVFWVLFVFGCGSKSGSPDQGSAAAVVKPALSVERDSFHCVGTHACSGSIEYTNVRVSGPLGTVFRVAGTEFKIDNPQSDRFSLDMIALADLVGVAAMLDKSKPLTVPLDVKLPDEPELHATWTVHTDVLVSDLGPRLAQIEKAPLARHDAAASKGALLVVLPEKPNDYTAKWEVRAIGGVDHPREAKVIILGKSTRDHKSCGKYKDTQNGQIIDLQLNVLDLELQSYDPVTGKPLAKAEAKASRKCPDNTMASSFVGVGGTTAKFDEAAAAAAAAKLAK
jgi:hypothetical protein